MTPVKLGPASGENVSIVSGLSAGDAVVTDGADKLKDGAKVALPGAAEAPEKSHHRKKGNDQQTNDRPAEIPPSGK